MATKAQELASQVDGLFDVEEEIDVPGPKVTTVSPPAPVPMPTIEEEPVPMPPVTTPKSNGRSRAKAAPRAPKAPAKSTAPRIAKFLPDAEHVKVHKVDMGQRRYIKSYSARDLARASDIEVFIQEHVMPIAGEGDYDVDVIDSKGEHKRTVPVNVMDPNKPPPGTTAVQVQESKILSTYLDKMEKLEAAVMAPPPAAKTFAEQLQEIAQVKGMLGVEEGGKSDSMTPMLMMMMMQKPQDVPVTSKAALDFAELRAEIRAAKDSMEHMSPALQLPPPLPMPDPNAGLAEIVKALAEANKKDEPDVKLADLIPLLKPEKPEPKQQWGIAEIGSVVAMVTPILDKLFGKKDNPEMDFLREQLRDMRADQREARNSRGSSIQDTMGDISAIMGLARNMAGGGQEETNFWSFANKLIENGSGIADSLGGMMSSIREDEQKALPQSRGTSSGDSDEGDDNVLDFPEGFQEKIEVLNNAKDAAERVGGMLLAFQFLGQSSANWRKYLTEVIAQAKDGKKDEVMEFLDSFLAALVEREFLTEEVAKATIEAFDKNYERAVDVLTGGAGNKE